MKVNIVWRRYQQELFNKVDLNKEKIFIHAPPGSGKTLIALELIRRMGKKAVVLAPTTLVAKQWIDKADWFF